MIEQRLGEIELEDIINWVVENKNLLFSGAGVAIIGGVIGLFIKRANTSTSQTIRSGNSSVNYQAGRDIKIESNEKNNK